ncbi:uncharacterized protein LOC107364426 [Tetranychus urticae]|uniref:uncharacterized protein LOC107364426 n=1 Tax=Tetranychus urticae TaxID=32264 RepID=UPI00077C07C5|nr:uncharacterized protein LOC107364426 [Tetranychus urticae]XP_015787251.1 uncharacterized protein LOC107364426 [Tetranychus urticae]XP_015787252.1 uncharacterized protein LOC107364426 [Tetranychus urticae]XP_015787254.1 uncharacterized protein LOC107364426 [Tetranychus urticae]XP_025017111.1 uncharacterized protein LOC107364426 [Tetranychus urticae]XP_025017112.1 uncharacterized protein LOC107364426 [Tetranychus urticae]
MRQMPEPGKGKRNDTTVASNDGLYTIQYTESESNDDISEGHMNDSKMIVMEHLYVNVSLRLDVFCKVSEGGLYECLHCPDVCPSIEEFKKHYKEKHLETFYDCTKCGFSTLCQGTMSDHVSRYHDNDASLVKRKLIRKVSAGSDEYQTSVYGSFISQSNKTKIPAINSNSSQVDKLDNVSPKPEMGRRPHERTKENELDSDIDKMDHDESDGSDSEGRTNESRHECKVCSQKFTRSERVREHYDAIHLNMVYICCICGYTNRWKRSVIQHLRSKHEKIPPYKHLMVKKRVDDHELNNKQPNFSNLQSQNQRIDDTTPNLSPFHDDDEEEEELRGRQMLAIEDRHFDSDLHDDMEDLEADDYDEGLDAGCEHELDLSRNSMTHQEKHLYKSNQGPADFSLNNQSQSPYETILICRICGYSHKWPLVMTNHFLIAHKLSPPYDKYIKETRSNSFSRMLDNFHSKPLMPSNNHKGGYLKEILDLSTSQYNRNNEANNSHFGFSLNSFAKSTPLGSGPNLQNYICKMCDKSFDTLRGLKEHTEGMHTDLVWACKLCPFTDKWRPQAISHLRNSHNCQPPYNDHLSRRNANSASNHISRPQSSEDSGSHLDLPSTSNSFSEHSSFDLPSGLRHCKEPKMNSKECYTKLANDQYQCTKCNKTCGSAQGITEHYEAFHLGMLYYCQLCDFTDVWRSMMTKHLRQKHQLGKPYDEYLKRVKLDPNSKQITDTTLMDNFRRRSNPMKNTQLSPEGPPLPHVILPHKSLVPQPSASSNGSSQSKTPKNLISNGRSLIATPSNGLMPTGGGVCLESKVTPKLQSSHKQDSSMGKQYIHLDNQLKCKLCGSVFTSLQGFQEHYEAIHLDVIWTCRKCPTSFRWRQQLTKHLKLIHECEPPFNEYMLKEAGSHKLKKPIPEKSPHGAYARRSILPKENESIDYKQSSLEDDAESSLPVIKDQDSINNEFNELAIPEDLSMSDKASFSSTTTTTTTTNNNSTPVTTPSAMKNYTYLNNQFLCKLCSANFTSLQGFQEHHEAVHLNIVFVCKLCGFTNRWRPQVTSHLKRNHAVDPPYADYLIKRPGNRNDETKDDEAKIDDMEIDEMDQYLDGDRDLDADQYLGSDRDLDADQYLDGDRDRDADQERDDEQDRDVDQDLEPDQDNDDDQDRDEDQDLDEDHNVEDNVDHNDYDGSAQDMIHHNGSEHDTETSNNVMKNEHEFNVNNL